MFRRTTHARYQEVEVIEEMNWRALEEREDTLGKVHPDTLTSVYCLAFLFRQQQQYEGYFRTLSKG
jgi:hypothetical protein